MNYNPDSAHIVYAADDRFAEILGVSLVSLYENSKDMAEITVYVLDSGISKENKDKLQSVCKKYSRDGIVFIPAGNISEKLSMEVATDRGSLSQYARLFISSDLPVDLGRVLYLDCDIIIKRSIKELWSLNLEGKTIGALMDAFSRHYRQNIELSENDIMFNSGVMLIDLDKWRQNGIEKKLLDFISRKNGYIQQGDQGALNAVLSRETYCFEPRFNSVTIFYDFTYEEMLIYRRPPSFYGKEQVTDAVKNPVIIHYTTSFKSLRPWIKDCQHPYVGEWLKYKSLSPWKDAELWEDKKPLWKKRSLTVFNNLPQWLSVRIAAVMQVYGRPLINKIKG